MCGTSVTNSPKKRTAGSVVARKSESPLSFSTIKNLAVVEALLPTSFFLSQQKIQNTSYIIIEKPARGAHENEKETNRSAQILHHTSYKITLLVGGVGVSEN